MSRSKFANPISPTKRPVSSSRTVINPKPNSVQCPTWRSSLCHASSRVSGRPPMNRTTAGSAHMTALASRSVASGTRKLSRALASAGSGQSREDRIGGVMLVDMGHASKSARRHGSKAKLDAEPAGYGTSAPLRSEAQYVYHPASVRADGFAGRFWSFCCSPKPLPRPPARPVVVPI